VLEASVEVDRREFAVAASLRVAAGERLALFGPSGSGKTTILEMIAGLVPPRRGQVVVAGRLLTQTWAPRVAVPPWQRRVGLLRQDPALFPHLSVRQNLEYGTGARPSPGRTDRLAAELGIAGLLGDRPARLSGGQAHRVALGRLLLAHCDVLLLDEPYAGLDAQLRRVLTGLVRSLAAERAVPTVLVAHELADAQAFADRLAVLDRGRLLQTGPAGEVVRRPASRKVAELVGYRAFVPVTGESLAAARAGAGVPPGEVASGAPLGEAAVVAGVHPERVVAGAHPERGLVLAGPVGTCHPAGAGWEAEIRAGPVAVWCRLPDRPSPGMTVTVLDPPCYGPDGALLPRSVRVRA
jgi:ABC-type sulfate/molybdate transport systems ATPase subunit